MGARGDHEALIGREHELERVDALVDALVAGRGGVAIVRGEAGIGKTSVLAALRRRAEQRGTATLMVAPQELDRRRPLGALVDALAPVAGVGDPWAALTGATDGGRDGPLSSVHPRVELGIAEAMLAQIAERASHGPLLVAVDDLHWADDASLVVLDRLARRSTALPVLVVGACRPLPWSDALRAWLGGATARSGTWIELGPLAEEAVATLVEQLGGRFPERAARVAAAGGNPLLISELLRGSLDDSGVVGGAASGSGDRFDAIVRERLSHLPEGSEALLRVAAVLGGAFTAHELAAVLERPVADLLPTPGCVFGGRAARLRRRPTGVPP